MPRRRTSASSVLLASKLLLRCRPRGVPTAAGAFCFRSATTLARRGRESEPPVARGLAAMRGDYGVVQRSMDFRARWSYSRGMTTFSQRLNPYPARMEGGHRFSRLAPFPLPGHRLYFAHGVAHPDADPDAHPDAARSRRRADLAQQGATCRDSGSADIPTSHRGRCANLASASPQAAPASRLAPLALGAFAVASALAMQRLLPQPRRQRLGAAGGGAVGGARAASRGSRGVRLAVRLGGRVAVRLRVSAQGALSRSPGRLRASGPADISTSHPVRSIGSLRHRHSREPARLLAHLLGAFAIASALASQRFLGQPRRHRLAAAGGDAVGGCGGRPCGRSCGRPCGRSSGRPCGRSPHSRKAGFSPAWCRLRALRLADISTSLQSRYTGSMHCSHPRQSMRLDAPLALGACAIASALAPQRFLANRRALAKRACAAVFPQRPLSRALRPRHRRDRLRAGCTALLLETAPAEAGGCLGAVGMALLACLAIARRGADCPESRRPRARAQSARVMAVHRKEVDLDRFVAALLALAADPGGHSGRRHKPAGESLRLEQSCRR